MNKRIKEIRKENKLTQQAFADILKVSKSTIESIEYSRRIVTPRTIADICREFKINEEWLVNGTGEKYATITREGQIADLVHSLAKSPDDSFTLKMAELLPQLSEKQLEALYNLAVMLEKKEDLP